MECLQKLSYVRCRRLCGVSKVDQLLLDIQCTFVRRTLTPSRRHARTPSSDAKLPEASIPPGPDPILGQRLRTAALDHCHCFFCSQRPSRQPSEIFCQYLSPSCWKPRDLQKPCDLRSASDASISPYFALPSQSAEPGRQPDSTRPRLIPQASSGKLAPICSNSRLSIAVWVSSSCF